MRVTHEYLIRYPERAMTVAQAAAYQNLVMRRAKGEPIAYLLGRHHFYDIEVCVTPDVLIPRPETELLVEKAIAWATGRHTFIVDVGAGSGIIALALAKHLPNAHITGIDLSPAALDLARCNAEHLGLKNRIRWLQGDLLKPILALGETADLIVANLPYIASSEMPHLEVSRHEPHLALDGGADGLDVIRHLLDDAPQVLQPTGMLVMEIGAGQGEAVRALAQAAFPGRTILVEPDLAGHDRMITVF
jgi:release factor glutamine methyltransferase